MTAVIHLTIINHWQQQHCCFKNKWILNNNNYKIDNKKLWLFMPKQCSPERHYWVNFKIWAAEHYSQLVSEVGTLKGWAGAGRKTDRHLSVASSFSLTHTLLFLACCFRKLPPSALLYRTLLSKFSQIFCKRLPLTLL